VRSVEFHPRAQDEFISAAQLPEKPAPPETLMVSHSQDPLTIDEIASAVSGAAKLSRAFTEVMGVRPGEYRPLRTVSRRR